MTPGPDGVLHTQGPPGTRVLGVPCLSPERFCPAVAISRDAWLPGRGKLFFLCQFGPRHVVRENKRETKRLYRVSAIRAHASTRKPKTSSFSSKLAFLF